jgi:hypothetical protein
MLVVLIILVNNVMAQKIKFPAVGLSSGVIFPQNNWDPVTFSNYRAKWVK